MKHALSDDAPLPEAKRPRREGASYSNPGELTREQIADLAELRYTPWQDLLGEKKFVYDIEKWMPLFELLVTSGSAEGDIKAILRQATNEAEVRIALTRAVICKGNGNDKALLDVLVTPERLGYALYDDEPESSLFCLAIKERHQSYCDRIYKNMQLIKRSFASNEPFRALTQARLRNAEEMDEAGMTYEWLSRFEVGSENADYIYDAVIQECFEQKADDAATIKLLDEVAEMGVSFYPEQADGTADIYKDHPASPALLAWFKKHSKLLLDDD